MLRFKWYLLNEEKAFLAHRLGDILTSVQNLEDDLGGLGVRQIARIADEIVNQIRKILHDDWSDSQMKYLLELQKVAVALKKAVDEKNDLKELIPQVTRVLQSLSAKMGVKTNNMEAPEQSQTTGMEAPMQLTSPPPPEGSPQQVTPPS